MDNNNKPKIKRKGRGGFRNAASYCARTPEAKQRQLDGLAKGRANGTGGRPKGVRTKQSIQRSQIADIQKANIIEFATGILNVSFTKRPAQEVVLRCLYGLPLNDKQLAIYKLMTGLKEEFEAGIEKTEANLDIGARGGKSFLTSIVAIYEATRDKWRQYLNPGETGYAVIIATRQKQAEDIIQIACSRMLEDSDISWMLKDQPLKASLELTNGMVIASFPCNSTAARGLPIILLIFDEIAWYMTEGVKADEGIFNALNPRRAQFPGAKCMKITTPAGKQGLFWREFDEGFKVPGRLTIKAHTRLMNPVIPQDFIDKEYKRDPDNAAREFGAEFAETVSGFFASCIDQLKACFNFNVDDMPYEAGCDYYSAIDQSGLSGRDKFGYAIAHKDSRYNKIIVDCVREWDTKDADYIMEEIRQLNTIYHCRDITKDGYAGGWVTNALEKRGLTVFDSERLPVVYVNLKTLVLAQRLALPDHPSLVSSLLQTQAFYSKSNNLTIGHERTSAGHGDLANAVARAIYEASREEEGAYYDLRDEPAVLRTRRDPVADLLNV